MSIKKFLKNIIRKIPGIEYIHNYHKSTGGTDKARYCYAVWMRHLINANNNGMNQIPKHVAEFGPGDTIGIGLCALLSGAEEYHALDVVKYGNKEKNIEIFDQLIAMFKNKSAIPQNDEFPNLKPVLVSYDFPKEIFPDAYLDVVLHADRLNKIRQAITAMFTNDGPQPHTLIHYHVPWTDSDSIPSGSLDMIFSQAVLQHIENLPVVFDYMYQWLKPGGVISHGVDLRSIGSADTWDGHWGFSDAAWKTIKGRRKLMINREPLSTYTGMIHDKKFKIIYLIKTYSESSFKDGLKPAPRFEHLTPEDYTVSGFFVQAMKVE